MKVKIMSMKLSDEIMIVELKGLILGPTKLFLRFTCSSQEDSILIARDWLVNRGGGKY